MLDLHPLTLAAPTQHLRQLTIIRSLLLVFLWAGFIFCVHYLAINTGPLGWIITALTVVNLATLARLKNLQLKNLRAVTQVEFFIQLFIDVTGLTALFFSSGGANNPFISYLLVPVCISAATLPRHFTWAITASSLVAYTLLLFFNIEFPLFAIGHHEHGRFSWHILGMWFNFFISAGLITYFVVAMANTLRQQQEALSRLREDELRNEQLVAVAMLAAGAAHEINTPLSTMTVLLQELRNDYQDNPNLLADLELLSQQVNHCAGTLKRLVTDSSSASLGRFSTKTMKDFCDFIIDRWQLMRPQILFQLNYTGDQLNQEITADPRLEQAIINVLNNAADASPHNIIINITASNNYLQWEIIDSGAGINHEVRQRLGKTTYTTKEHGLGLGIMITHATLKSYGGTVAQTPGENPGDNKGTITRIKIPAQANSRALEQ